MSYYPSNSSDMSEKLLEACDRVVNELYGLTDEELLEVLENCEASEIAFANDAIPLEFWDIVTKQLAKSE
jgi:hypothetical protein